MGLFDKSEKGEVQLMLDLARRNNINIKLETEETVAEKTKQALLQFGITDSSLIDHWVVFSHKTFPYLRDDNYKKKWISYVYPSETIEWFGQAYQSAFEGKLVKMTEDMTRIENIEGLAVFFSLSLGPKRVAKFLYPDNEVEAYNRFLRTVPPLCIQYPKSSSILQQIINYYVNPDRPQKSIVSSNDVHGFDLSDLQH